MVPVRGRHMINWLISAALQAAATIVSIGSITQSRTSTTTPLVGARFLNTGQQQRVLSGVYGGSPSWTSTGFDLNWLNKTISGGGGYSIRATASSPTANWEWDAGSDSFGSWLSLATAKSWYGASNNDGIDSVTLQIEISNDGGTTVLDTASGTLTSEFTV